MITNINHFKKLIKEKKIISDTTNPKSGKMHKVLGIPTDKDIIDVYTSGKKLAKDLVDKVGKKKAAGMLAFVANINKEENIYDVALRALDKINESVINEAEEGEVVENPENENETEHTVGETENTPRLMQTVLDALNAQIKNELVSSQIYKGMACWLDDKGWMGASKYFFKSGQEELIHMDKIYNFIFDRNALAVVPGCETVKQEFTDIRNVVEESLQHEIQVTKQWEAIAELAKTEGDNTTFIFAQWFLNEQIEEENKFRDLLFKFDLDMPNWKIDELFETL